MTDSASRSALSEAWQAAAAIKWEMLTAVPDQAGASSNQPSVTCAGWFWLVFRFGNGWWVCGVVGWLLAQVGEVIDQIIPSDEKSPTILHNVSS